MLFSRFSGISIRWKLAVPFLLLSFTGTVLLAYVGLAYRWELIDKEEQRRMLMQYVDFATEMVDARQFVVGLAETAARNPEVQKALAQRDRDRLIQLLYPTYLVLKEDFGIRYFHFHVPPATSFLRLHRLEQYGEDMSGYRNTILQAVQTGEPASGLEKGTLGYGIRGVVPVFHDNSLVGTVEVGSSFGRYFIEKLRKRTGADYAIYIREEDGGFSRTQATDEAGAPLPQELLRQAFQRDRPKILISPPEYPHSGVLLGHIRDFSGRNIGLLEIRVDRSEAMRLHEDALKMMTIVGIVGILLSFAGVMWATRRFLRPIQHIIFQARAIADEKRQTFLEPIPMDEIGVLNESINVMLSSLKRSREQIESYAAVLETRVQERTADLIESEEKYRTLVENVPLVVYRVRPDGEIVFINQFVEEVFGYTPTEIFRNPALWSERIFEEDRNGVVVLRRDSFQSGKEFVAEYRVRHKQGHIVYVMDHAIPFRSADGSVTSVDGIIMDVTSRVQLQEKLVRSEEIKTISEVSARLAHEIRNPLVSAGGFARRLLASMSPDDPNWAKVEIIVKEVRRLEGILRMVIHYIQPVEINRSPTDVNAMLESVLFKMEEETRRRNIRVEFRPAPKLPTVSLDRPKMEQVLSTLLKNALYQVEEESWLAVSTREVGRLVRMRLHYHPRHMSADDVDHFFYPFTTTQLAVEAADLPMSKIVVDKHGGVIEVKLDALGNLSITITLPASKG